MSLSHQQRVVWREARTGAPSRCSPDAAHAASCKWESPPAATAESTERPSAQSPLR